MSTTKELLKNVSWGLERLTDATDLDSCAESLLQRLENREVTKVDSILLVNLLNEFFAKITTFIKTNELTPSCLKLIVCARQLDLLSPIYNFLLAHVPQQEFPPFSQNGLILPLHQQISRGVSFQSPKTLKQGNLSQSANDTRDSLDSLKFTLDELFKGSEQPVKFTGKIFGYSLLDTNGDFLWMDEKSENLFEVKKMKAGNINLFDLIVPYSKAVLNAHFGQKLFGDGAKLNESVTFPFAIYSHESMKRFAKSVNRLGANSKKNQIENLKKDSKQNMYKQYLRTLSCRATLVAVRFDDLEEYQLSKAKVSQQRGLRKRKITTKNWLKTRKIGRGPEGKNTRSDLESDAHYLGRNEGGFAFEPQLDLGAQSGEENSVTRLAIMLETRLSYRPPEINCEMMETDPQIREFEEKLFNAKSGI